MAAGTAYTKAYAGGFVDKPSLTTPIQSSFLNAVEAALLQLIGSAPTADGQVMQWDFANTRFGPALLLNKNVDAAAAIDKSKLNLAGQIVDADVSGSAAISRSKLNFGSGLVNADVAAAAAIALSKLADPGSGFVIGSTGSGAIAVRPPGYELNYTQITATPSKPGGTGQGSAVTIISPGALTFDGGPYMFEFFAPSCDNPGGNSLIVELHDGTSFLGMLCIDQVGSTALKGMQRLSPSAGSHTYTVKQWNSGGTGYGILCDVGGSGVRNPAYLRITKA